MGRADERGTRRERDGKREQEGGVPAVYSGK